MRLFLRSALVVAIPLMLSGCISLSSSAPPPPAKGTTVVVPQGGAPVTCPSGTEPPC